MSFIQEVPFPGHRLAPGDDDGRMVFTDLLHGFCQISSGSCVADSIHKTVSVQDVVPVQTTDMNGFDNRLQSDLLLPTF